MEEYEVINNAKEWEVSHSACCIARMLSNGSVIPEEYVKRMFEGIEVLKTKQEAKAKIEVAPVVRVRPNVQKNIKDKAYALIDVIEKMIEQSKYVYFSMFDFLKSKDISGDITKHIYDYFNMEQQEYVNIKTDKELREAYRHLSVEEINERIDFFNRFLRDVLTYQIFVTKGNDLVKDISKQENFKQKIDVKHDTNIQETINLSDYVYKKEFKKRTSISPAEIIGAKAVYTWNTKTNFLHYLECENKSLSIKGSRIINVDIKKSWAKIITFDYKEVITAIDDGCIPTFVCDVVKNKTVYRPITLSNEYTIILKVIKS
jgi:hypothetical protein